MWQKSIVLLLTLLLLHEKGEAKAVDTTKSRTPKFHKNLFEIGTAHFNLFNGDGYNDWRSPKFFSYTRFFKRSFFARIENYNYSRGTNHYINVMESGGKLQPGDVLFTEFRFVRLSFGKRFMYHNFFTSPAISVNYRWGAGEQVFIAENPSSAWPEPYTDDSKYKSVGLGLGNSIGYILKNRVTFSIDCQVMYNFEKTHSALGDLKPEGNVDFTPNRLFSTLHFKLGVLFL